MASGVEPTSRTGFPAGVLQGMRKVEASRAATDVAILALRATLGLVFIGHGAQKLFGAFGGFGIEGTGSFFASLGITPGEFWAVVAGVVELGGGVLLAIGLLAPLAAILIAVEMVVAIVKFNWAHGFFTETPDSGWEINLLLIAMAVAVALLGAGRISVDRLLGRA